MELILGHAQKKKRNPAKTFASAHPGIILGLAEDI